MSLINELPLDAVAAELRARADAASGVEGALFGAGLGVVTTIAAARGTSGKLSIPALLAGAALGLAYGAVDVSSLTRRNGESA